MILAHTVARPDTNTGVTPAERLLDDCGERRVARRASILGAVVAIRA
jgi:hypothetical protein